MRNRSAILFLIALSFVIAPSQGWAEDPSLSVTNTLNGEWRDDNRNGIDGDDDYAALINRLNVSSSLGGLTAQMRADGFYFHALDASELSDGFKDDLLLERITLRYKSTSWVLTGGDFYRQLGRGILLSLRKPDEIAVDISIQGGMVEYKTKKHHATLFAGRSNSSNIDSVSQKHIDDVNDVFTGLSYKISPLRALKVEAFGLFVYPREEILEKRSHSLSGGLSVELPAVFEWLSVYVEGDVQSRKIIDEQSQGYAAYGSGNLTFGDLGFVVQGLYLKDIKQEGSRNTALGQQFRYNRPPTLERFDQEVLNNSDVIGGSLQSEYYFFDLDLLLQATGTYRINDPGETSENTSLHAHGLVQTYFQDGLTRLALSGGWRDERTLDEQLKTQLHAEVDYLQSITDALSTHLQVVHQSRTLEAEPYNRGSVLFGLEWAKLGSATFEFGYDTQNTTEGVRNLFYAGILTWNQLDFLEMRLTVGTRRGGIRCIAGICRNFPNFSGVQTTAVMRF